MKKRTMAQSEDLCKRIWEHFRSAAPAYCVVRIVGDSPEDWLFQVTQTYDETVSMRARLYRSDRQFASFDSAEGGHRFVFTDCNLNQSLNAESGKIEFYNDLSAFELYETKKFVDALKAFRKV